VGGYVQDYDGGLSFATVRNAGHMVPYTQPAAALHLLSAFLAGEPLHASPAAAAAVAAGDARASAAAPATAAAGPGAAGAARAAPAA